MPDAPTCRGSIMLGTACMRCERCRHERERIARLFSAAERVERWWIEEGMHKFDGAPECMFALRDALSKK